MARSWPVQTREGFTGLPNAILARAIGELTPEQFRLFLGLVYSAEWRLEGGTSPDGRWRIGRGQVLVSYDGLAAKYGMEWQAVRRALRRFKQIGLATFGRASSGEVSVDTSADTPPDTHVGTSPTLVDFGIWFGIQAPAKPPDTPADTPPDTSPVTIQQGNTEHDPSSLRSEVAPSASAPAPASPVVASLPCVGNGPKAYDVTEAQVAKWAEAFPGIDVLGEVRKAVAWLEANPTKRKTHRGCPAFLVRWLGSAQDKGARSPGPSGAKPQDIRFGSVAPAPHEAFGKGGRRVIDGGPAPATPAPLPDGPPSFVALLRRVAEMVNSEQFRKDLVAARPEEHAGELWLHPNPADPFHAARLTGLYAARLAALGADLGVAIRLAAAGPRAAGGTP